MTEEEIIKRKSLALAELLNIRGFEGMGGPSTEIMRQQFCPYNDETHFTRVFTSFPEVMLRFDEKRFQMDAAGYGGIYPVQQIVLDEILKMAGRWQEAWDE